MTVSMCLVTDDVCTVTDDVCTIILYRKLREQEASKFHIQLCISLFCTLIGFVSGIDQTCVYEGCVTVSVLVHYFKLVMWMWMGRRCAHVQEAGHCVWCPSHKQIHHWRLTCLLV